MPTVDVDAHRMPPASEPDGASPVSPNEARDIATGRGPHRWQVVVPVLLLCLLSGLIGWWIAQPDDTSFNDVDTGFLSDMSTHHQGAIQMSFGYLRNENDGLVGHFAREIIVTQSMEIAMMNSLLADAGDPANASDDVAMDWMGMATDPAQMPGMATEEEFAELRDARGRDADDRFTELMVRHHAAGADMAEYAAQHGRNARVKALATRMATVQRAEIREMNQRREQLGLAPIDAAQLEDVEMHHS